MVFLIVSIIDRGLGPAVGTADGGYLVAVLRGDGDATRHLDLYIGAEVGAGASDDILTKWVDDNGVERVIGCPLTNNPMEAVVLAGTGLFLPFYEHYISYSRA